MGPSERIHPIRTPGAMILDTEFSRIVCADIPGRDAMGAMGSPV